MTSYREGLSDVLTQEWIQRPQVVREHSELPSLRIEREELLDAVRPLDGIFVEVIAHRLKWDMRVQVFGHKLDRIVARVYQQASRVVEADPVY